MNLGWTLFDLIHKVTSKMENTGLATSFSETWNYQRVQLVAEKTTTRGEGETPPPQGYAWVIIHGAKLPSEESEVLKSHLWATVFSKDTCPYHLLFHNVTLIFLL